MIKSITILRPAPNVAPGSILPAGPPGLNAYQIALVHGFVGTEGAWLASLKGDPGDTTPAFLAGVAAADHSRSLAQDAAAAAAGSASTASTKANDASSSATASAASAATSTTKAGDASTSASSAAGSASNSANSATAAAGSATSANASKVAAATSETNAGNSASAASTSATNAGNSATAAAGSASSANASKIAAATSEANAAASAVQIQNWAEKLDGPVTGSLYSAHYWANDAAASAAAAQTWNPASYYTKTQADGRYVKQGGGAGQLTNVVYIGWSGTYLKAQVDATDLGNFVFSANPVFTGTAMSPYFRAVNGATGYSQMLAGNATEVGSFAFYTTNNTLRAIWGQYGGQSKTLLQGANGWTVVLELNTVEVGTAPAGDRTTKLASTTFFQNELERRSIVNDTPQSLPAANTLIARQNIGVLGSGIVVSTAAAATLTAADSGKFWLYTGTTDVTWTLPAATSGAAFYVRNSSTKTMTVSASGGDLIGGATTRLLYNGQECWFIADTVGIWRIIGLNTRIRVFSIDAASGTTEIVFALPDGHDLYEITAANALPTSGVASLVAVLSFDGGATYKTGSSDYASSVVFGNGSSAVGGGGNRSSLPIINAVNANTGNFTMGTAKFYRGKAGRPAGLVSESGFVDGSPAHRIDVWKGESNTAGKATHIKFTMSPSTIASLVLNMEAIAI